ncbi:MAG TPA: AraC family transcriptional regulator [Chthoniobacteraceae bacterium]|nr:AraC family transcriptional regulator [Chthoniobacteraceae bacterium]
MPARSAIARFHHGPGSYRVFSIQPEEKIAVAGCEVMRLALHRHSDLLRTTGIHRHRHHQLLVYLRGSGKVRTGAEILEITTGTGLLLPKGCAHEFIRHSRRNPLCLAIDFLCEQPLGFVIQKPGVFRLSILRKLVNELAHFRDGGPLSQRLQRDGIAAQLLGLCLGMLVPGEAAAMRHSVNLLLRIEQKIEQSPGGKLSLADAAQMTGYQKDYLNRILKEQSGMTFGQIRAQVRLRQARSALKRHGSVNAAAAAVGFDDVNYFVRWFRKQTGQTPGQALREGG